MTLYDYLYDTYDVLSIGTERDEIISLARQEMRLPSETEIKEASNLYAEFEGCPLFGECGFEDKHFRDGVEWALSKVRNPYPYTQ
jgi:hypothetical protein